MNYQTNFVNLNLYNVTEGITKKIVHRFIKQQKSLFHKGDLRYCSEMSRVTSSFILIESASGMPISLDYQPIEVNTDVATESYVTECNCRDKATQMRNFVISQA